MDHKKHTLFALSTLILATSLLNADNEVRMRNLENRIVSLENSQNGCCAINPPARPFSPDAWGFYVAIDPFIWQANVDAIPVAVRTKGSDALFNETGKSQIKTIDFDWDFGFRLGLGLNTTHDAWDLLLQWTYWNTETTSSFGTRNTIGVNFPSQGHPAVFLDGTSGTIRSKWKMNYNLLDLTWGRDFFVSKYLSIRPFSGLRSAWIKQRLRVDYEHLSAPNSLLLPGTKRIVKKEDRFFGIGVRGGIETQWSLCGGFGLFSNYAVNLLYAYHDIDQQGKSNQMQSLNTLDVDSFYHVGNASLDAQIGLRYDWVSCDCCYHLGFDLGWEHHWHGGQNQFVNFSDCAMEGKYFASQGDLGIQGYFLKIRFDF